MTKPLTAYEAALRARMITAACTLAHHRATEAVKAALRARGLRVTEYSHRELGLLAVEYAKRHGPELLNDAAETIERWRTEGFFGKRAQACFVQPLALANRSMGMHEIAGAIDAFAIAQRLREQLAEHDARRLPPCDADRRRGRRRP